MFCVVTGLFPDLVTRYLTQPAADAVFNASGYINAMMGSGYAESVMSVPAMAPAVTYVEVGVWQPVSWLLILVITLLAITIVAIGGQYDRVSESVSAPMDSKYDLFFGGEESVYSQVGGEDLFWGFKHNWRGYFSFMHKLHSGIVNDYSLWAVVALALVTLYMLIVF